MKTPRAMIWVRVFLVLLVLITALVALGGTLLPFATYDLQFGGLVGASNRGAPVSARAIDLFTAPLTIGVLVLISVLAILRLFIRKNSVQFLLAIATGGVALLGLCALPLSLFAMEGCPLPVAQRCMFDESEIGLSLIGGAFILLIGLSVASLALTTYMQRAYERK